MIFNWQQRGWPKATVNKAALRDELDAFKIALRDAIEPLNEPLNERLLRLVGTHPGTNLQYLTSVVSVSRATVKRAVAALVAAGKIEHRGSKKTGGYYAKETK